MKINEVLECVNKVLDKIRQEENIETKGHFVATVEIKKSMGPYKQCEVSIIYVNINKQKNFPFCKVSTMERCIKEEEQKLIESVEKEALISFFMLQHNSKVWNQIIEGEYGVE